MNKLIKYDLVRALKDVTFEKDKLCSASQARKQVSNTHPKKSMMSASKAFELLRMELFGPTIYISIGGNKYGFVIVDDLTRYTWVFFLIDKSDVFATYHGVDTVASMLFESVSEYGSLVAWVDLGTQESYREDAMVYPSLGQFGPYV